jgi:integrase
MPSKRIPKYGLHKATNQARTTIDGHSVYLGPHGSPESKSRYREVVERWQERQRSKDLNTPDISIGELAILYDSHVRQHYVKDGRPTSEQCVIRAALHFLLASERHTLVRDFGPRRFKAVRAAMVSAGTCRETANKYSGRIRRLIRWGVGEEFVPPYVLAAIVAIDGLKAGRTEAKEKAPVGPVPLRDVLAIRRYLSPQITAMIKLQIRTAMRPGEVVVIRSCDIDTTGETWSYSVAGHKTEHRGRRRVVFIGPKAQCILRPFLKPDDPEAFIFSPLDVEIARNHAPRPGRRRRPRRRYDVHSYRRAVQRACNRAGVSAWCPSRLRHTAATIMRQKSDIETVRTVLGHASAVTSEIYAERDWRSARRLINDCG